MNQQQSEFLLQALETELGGEQIYEVALRCARNEDLKREWKKYLDETRTHIEIYVDLLTGLGIDTAQQSTGREIVRNRAASLMEAMEHALEVCEPAAAEIVAAECIVDAETKCHLNWELVGQIAKNTSGEAAEKLKEAYEQVEVEEDEHLYHTAGWARELWIKHLGMAAVLPPPEEEKHVKTAIGAARAKNAREQLLS